MASKILEEFKDLFEVDGINNIGTRTVIERVRNDATIQTDNDTIQEENELLKKRIKLVTERNDKLNFELIELRMFKLMHGKLKQQYKGECISS
jgi:hypothetical protein